MEWSKFSPKEKIIEAALKMVEKRYPLSVEDPNNHLNKVFWLKIQI